MKDCFFNWKEKEDLSDFSIAPVAIAAKSLQLCLTLCDPREGSPPGSPVPGILQARTPEWVAISFSSAWKWKVKVKSLSHVRLLATPWTAAHQAPPSMGFSRQEYWTGVPLPSPSYHQMEELKKGQREETSVHVILSNSDWDLKPLSFNWDHIPGFRT